MEPPRRDHFDLPDFRLLGGAEPTGWQRDQPSTERAKQNKCRPQPGGVIGEDGLRKTNSWRPGPRFGSGSNFPGGDTKKKLPHGGRGKAGLSEERPAAGLPRQLTGCSGSISAGEPLPDGHEISAHPRGRNAKSRTERRRYPTFSTSGGGRPYHRPTATGIRRWRYKSPRCTKRRIGH